jgi:hypothetical protein
VKDKKTTKLMSLPQRHHLTTGQRKEAEKNTTIKENNYNRAVAKL